MPVAKKDFEKMGEVTGRKSNTTPKILEFLGRKPDMAYTNKEVAEATGLNQQTVSQRLRTLAQKKQIVRKQDASGTVWNAIAQPEQK